MLYKMAISGFEFSLVFDTQRKIRFFKNKYKIKILEDIQKTEIYSIGQYTNYQCTNFQANIFISVRAMPPKPGKGDDVTFLNHMILAFLIVAHQNK